MFQAEPTSNPQIEVENPYKALADAIRRGAKMTAQCKAVYYERHSFTKPVSATCAIGAAGLGIGLDPSLIGFTLKMMRAFPMIDSLFMRITAMNDYQGLSREAIADWVQSLGE